MTSPDKDSETIMWTKERPTEQGWYWWRHDKESDGFQCGPEPVLIIGTGDVWWRGDSERVIEDGKGEWWLEKISEPV